MTREEAINYIQPIADSASLPRYAEALNMAISALREQEERSKGCSACDGGFGDNTMVFYAGGYKHCPMCGRRLEEV